ncbi:Cna B-type domain-containing protein, partial [Loigolactobacillus bifermentans]
MITNTHQPSVTKVSGTKKWDDNQNQDGLRPKAVTINLLANGKQVAQQQVTAADHWRYRFKNLPMYQSGKKIVYTITEATIKDYTTQVKGYDVTNHYTPMKTGVTVTKHWNDQADQDGLRPKNIKVQLYANGKKSGAPVILSEATDWTYTWKELAAKQNGKQIKYVVKETKKIPGYTTQIDQHDQGNIM